MAINSGDGYHMRAGFFLKCAVCHRFPRQVDPRYHVDSLKGHAKTLRHLADIVETQIPVLLPPAEKLPEGA